MAKRKLEAELDAVADDRVTSLVKKKKKKKPKKPVVKRTAIEGRNAVSEQAVAEKRVEVKVKKTKKKKKKKKQPKPSKNVGVGINVAPAAAFEAEAQGRERREKKKKDYQKKNRKERDRRPRQIEAEAAQCSHNAAGKIPHEALRQQIIDTCLHMEKSGINQGTSGNVSARVENGMFITPSGVGTLCSRERHACSCATRCLSAGSRIRGTMDHACVVGSV